MLYYETIENKNSDEWVLFIHCIAGNRNIFKSQINEYSKHYNLLMIDLPGHGKSSDWNYKFTFEDVSNSIINILNKLKIKKTNIVSLSLGSIVALYISILHPNRINQMVLGGAVLGLSTTLSKVAFKFINKFKTKLPKRVSIKAVGLIMLPRKKHKTNRNLFIKSAIHMNENQLFQWLDLMNNYFEIFDNELKNIINKSNIPKLYIMGEKDFMFLKNVLSNVFVNDKNKVYTISNCGHICNMDSKDDFNSITLDFLGEDNK